MALPSFGGLQSSNPLGGTGLNSGQSSGLGTSDDLLNLAQMQGGSVAQAAQELVHPTTGILSTIGNDFKQAFSGFVNVISTPSHVVAGILDPNKTIGEAIADKENPSEVIWGKQDPNASTMQKVGGFLVRTATDVLLDPLTYLTFGAGEGIFGMRTASKITLGEEAAAQIGKVAGDTAHLTQESQNVYKYLKAVENQAKGLPQALENLPKTVTAGKELAPETFDLAESHLKQLMNDTVDAPLNLDLAKKTISNMLESKPQLAETLLDKGGIKYFGRVILSGQRIGAVIDTIPVLKKIDTLTEPVRNAVGSLFNPRLIKDAEGNWTRLPEEYVSMKQALKDIGQVRSEQAAHRLEDIIKGNGVNSGEFDILADSLRNRKLPSDPKLANVYRQVLGIKDEELKWMRSTGVPISDLQNHVGNILVPNKIQEKAFNAKFAATPGAAKTAGFARYIEQSGQDVSTVLSKEVGSIAKDVNNKPLIDAIQNAKSTQDVGFAVDEHLNKVLDQAEAKGIPIDKALQEPKVQELMDFRSKVDQLPQNSELLGTTEGLKLSRKITKEEETRIIGLANKTVEDKNVQIGKIGSEIQTLAGVVHDVFKEKVLGGVENATKGLNINNTTYNEFLKVIGNQIGEADIQKLVKSRLENSYSEGVKLPKEVSDAIDGELSGVSKGTLQKVKDRLAAEEGQLPADIESLKSRIDAVMPKAPQEAVAGESADKVLSNIRELKFKSQVKRFTDISNGLDKNATARMIQILKDQFDKDPNGVKRALDAIIGKKQDVSDLLNDIELAKTTAKQNLSELPNTESFFSNADGNMYKRVAASAKDARDAGFANFELNPFIGMAKRGIDNARQGTAHEFMRDLARYMGKWEGEAPSGYVPVEMKGINDAAGNLAQTLIGKDGQQMLFHPAVAADVGNLMKSYLGDDATNDFLKYFDKVQSYWKASVTSVFPMFHGRNAISNVFLNFLDLGHHVFDPASHGLAIDIMGKSNQIEKLSSIATGIGEEAETAKNQLSDLLSKKYFTDATGHDWTYGEMRQVIKENNIAFTRKLTNSADNARDNIMEDLGLAGQSTSQKIKGALNPLNTKTFALTKFGQETVGGNIEGQARILNFISNLRKTGDVQLAAARTKMFLFDYGNLTNFEKNVMRRVVPFYTFTRKNLALQAHVLMTTPGRISAEIHALTSLGDVLSGGQLTDQEQAALPDWVKSGIGILADRKGSTVSILQGLGTPIEQPFQAFQPNQILGSISPLLRVPLEQMSGYSFYQGKMLSDVTNAAGYKSAPKALKDFIGYTEIKGSRSDGTPFTWSVSLHPERMNLVNNLPFGGRVLSGIKQIQAVDVSNQYKVMQQLVGVRPYSFDLQQEAAKRENEVKQQLEDLLTKAGVTAQFTRTFIPKR